MGALGTATDPEAVRTGSRSVYFGVDFVDCPTYDGSRLAAVASLTGPALIEEPFTVVVVPPGARCTLGAHGSYELVLGGA